MITLQLGKTVELEPLLAMKLPDRDLRATVLEQLKKTFRRDGADVKIDDVRLNGQMVEVDLSGDDADKYRGLLDEFFRTAALAIRVADDLRQKNQWNPEWRGLYAPVGLSLLNSKCVQLLHFPPLSAYNDRDYLKDSTSEIWERTLRYVDSTITRQNCALYESIVDLLPIAARHDAGDTLQGLFTAFKDYTLAMLTLLVKSRVDGGKPKPIVAYGSDVHKWLKSDLKLDVDLKKDRRLFELTLPDGSKAPIFCIVHPSAVWLKKGEDEYSDRGVKIRYMQEVYMAALWHLNVVNNMHPQQAWQAAKQHAADPERLCMLVQRLLYERNQDTARFECEHGAVEEVRKAIRPGRDKEADMREMLALEAEALHEVAFA